MTCTLSRAVVLPAMPVRLPVSIVCAFARQKTPPASKARPENPATKLGIGCLRAYAPQLALPVMDVPPETACVLK